LILDRLWDDAEPTFVSDAANAAYTLYMHDQPDVSIRLRRGNAVQMLTEMGYDDDIDYCFEVDAVPVLPYYTDNRLVLHDEMPSASPSPRRRASGT
jgi:2-phosphosulfolactate phosphatase